MLAKARLVLVSVMLFLGACTGPGVDGGGETPTNNGGVAFIVMTVMLLLILAILWFILGREE